MKKILSIIVPTYNEEENIEYAYSEIKKTLAAIPQYDYEIIFTDNNSRDRSREIINSIIKKDKKVTALFMSRTFSAEYSTQAAMHHVIGHVVTFIDCDLQDHPSLIPKFLREWEKGYDMVIGIRPKIKDTFIMSKLRKLFYIIFRKIASMDVPLYSGSFCLLDRRINDIIANLPERNRFFRGLRAWVGFNVKQIEYKRRERKFGTTKNSMFDYLGDMQRALLGFSFVPLDIITTLGLVLAIPSFVFIFSYLFLVLSLGNPLNASIPILLAIFFFGGIQLLAISVVGKYIQIIFEEVKQRPSYIIDKVINDHSTPKFRKFYEKS
ncbi:hypothetical protein A3H80_04840 [Candidatus Roizmanbacteria bacterium RIFCSPLOWO2_02_FULL_37_19]|uniref:Glycosyltransferase 2-like domain-containing protein n=1 Tax=Candidatus Roizmanbacteria bacterium RIFCSPHIGHO2_02_FULL_37_24 TaxID=1802037 RepID=A0A1F7GW08_9BACT|nr:MAG: hypothetical protein A2862_02140 [Candidatus Roizmanbacteria bacterium RIFCSPHIGHO2_01_FULL_38_41]OGK23199.1 MAG: hypothetical protein A3C24_00895 [Candidatus Roizmanbacteria bacterium RIFCSPHIGHO2_02_FULL_37_24]OGK32473.1 MAG: hypothetical protein A3E10_01305 [Candidatus Roizmanbacteria bacterium RIFCSPHIGHO2_12_FULL_37_23]OGK43612.1 MAG: hypothetical protein A2956_04240 [Candidatus Roizmanbacteria bacterium RIFCSPLOWO2_01_FULL_37_57]OGK54806.1 MAG: hypothetical protein A3H80_04840 [Ca